MASVPSPERTESVGALEAALDAELHHFERLSARLWLIISGFGMLAGFVLAATVTPALGLGCAAVSALLLGWFLWVFRRLGRSEPGPGLRTATAVVESVIPWAYLVALLFTEGAAYAIGSWVPPVLFVALILGQTARLRATASLLVGVVGALTYPLLYLLLLATRLEPAVEGMPLFELPMQITRSVSLLVVGLVGAFMARGLRRAFTRAGVVFRQQDLFGKYRLVREIASGGMGTVHEALYCPEGGFQRRVAVKRIHPHLAREERFVSGFRNEAEISARLAHPNIVQVFDFGSIGSSYFLAMEYVDGMSLFTFAKKLFAVGQHLPVHVVGTIGREILAGLTHAHGAALGHDGRPMRVVHRDLCPQNVLLSRNGEVKITDFGVARVLSDAAVSQSVAVVGHMAYIAPEQARGDAIDRRSDLFPVGVMLWELLTGQRLFYRGQQGETILALLYDEVRPPSWLRADIDLGWDHLVARALCRDPDGRFASAREMGAALDALTDSHSEGATRELAELVELVSSLGEVSPAEPTVTVPDGIAALPAAITDDG